MTAAAPHSSLSSKQPRSAGIMGAARGLLALCAAALLSLGLLVSFQAAAQSPADRPSFETGSLTIETAEGARHDFTIELAATSDQKAFGLMFVRDLAADAGMLFLHPREREITMWMKNTFIPLDMIFIDSGGEIVSIAERAVPQSLRTIRSGADALAVLEVNGGTASRLDIEPGDRVLHEAFGTAE